MCDPLTLGLILTATGTGAQVANQQAALRRQDREAARGIRRQGQIQEDANQRVQEQVSDIERSTGETERAEVLEGFLTALRQAQEPIEGGLEPVAGADPRFAESVEGGRTALRRGGAARAGRLSRIDAPAFQRLNERVSLARTGSDLNEARRRSAAEDFLTRLRVSEEQPNQFVDILGSVARGAGGALTLGADGGLTRLLQRPGANAGRLFREGTLIDPAARPLFTRGLA